MPWNKIAREDPRKGKAVRLPYKDRAEAGRVLAERLAPLGLDGAVVLALPRGGVPVGYEVARRLGGPLDVLVTRKIGCPAEPELGVGAVAEGGSPVFNQELLDRLVAGGRRRNRPGSGGRRRGCGGPGGALGIPGGRSVVSGFRATYRQRCDHLAGPLGDRRLKMDRVNSRE